MHDVAALTNTEAVNLLLIVIDNDGGGIFSTLPQRGIAGFESIFGTPHGIDIAKLPRVMESQMLLLKTLLI